MNILSLFDGKSSGYTAAELAGIKVDNYYSSEVDKYAIQVSNAIHPNQVRLGDVTKWREWDIDWASIDLILGGFPCQAWSMAGKQLGDKDERGVLFWVMLDIMKEVRKHNPKSHFLIENVKMKKEFEQYITHHAEQALCEVHKILINSALVSAQNRNRYYWTSFKVEQPEDKGVVLTDILEVDCLDVNSDGWHKWWKDKKDFQTKKRYSAVVNDGSIDKAICMTARQFASWNGNFVKCESCNDNKRIASITENERGYRPHKGDKAKSGISELGRILKPTAGKTDTLTTSHAPKMAVNNDISDLKYRKLTPRECFRLQTVPEHYIDKILACGVSNTQLYKIAGNGWTDEVIAHIFRAIK